MNRPEDDKEFMEVVGHLISHPRFQKLDGIVPVSYTHLTLPTTPYV